MYSSCTIIATPHEGANELIIHKENGLLISDSNPAEIAKALEKLLYNSTLREQLATTGEITIRTKFNWHNSAIVYTKVFETL